MPYDNTTRVEAARANRRRILAAAARSFVNVGYAATTIKSVAEACKMSQEYVYKSFGGKAGLLKAVYDTTLAGDDEPVPMALREHAQAISRAGTPQEAADAWAEMVLTVGERVGPLLQAVAAAGATDPAAQDLLCTMNEERLAGATMVAAHWADRGWLRSDATTEAHARTLWILNSPQVRDLFDTSSQGVEGYRQWLVRMVECSVLAASGSD